VAHQPFGNKEFSEELWGMFLKSIHKYCKAEKSRFTYYRLCESYRDEFGFARQRMVIGLGRLEELPDIDQKIRLCERINELAKGEPTLYSQSPDPLIEQLAQHYYQQIKSKKKIDYPPKPYDDIETVELNTLKNRDVREIGAESICYQAFRQLGLDSYLKGRGWGKEQISLAATHIVSRTVYPASELKTVSWIKNNSAVCELTGYDAGKVTKDKLYWISKQLYAEKDGLENHLSRCTNELFNLHDKIILYDLTNTYFEGRMQSSRKARFGRSKEKRNDAKIIVLAVIVNIEGFLKYSDIFEGNTSDSSTLKTVIRQLDKKAGYIAKKPIVVMDAGIATEANIHFLKEEGYPYLCVSRPGIKDYSIASESSPIQIVDKKKQPIELLQVQVANESDHYLWVKSHVKAEKENSMHNQFTRRFEEGLRGIQNGIVGKWGTKRLEKVWERIGRLKEKYPSVHQYYQINVTDNGRGTATCLSFERKDCMPYEERAGVYFLRTSLDWADEQTMWTIYNAIREIEYTFRVLKTDLDLRPIFHKTDEGSMAHLHLGLLAYWLVSTIRYQLKLKGYHHDWREIVRTMNSQKIVTTTIETPKGETIQIRQCSEPSTQTKELYTKLNYKTIPLPRKKSVWHTGEVFKNEKADCLLVMDG
jgi:transposase